MKFLLSTLLILCTNFLGPQISLAQNSTAGFCPYIYIPAWGDKLTNTQKGYSYKVGDSTVFQDTTGNEFYHLKDAAGNTLEEGRITETGVGRYGRQDKWTAYYKNGTIKTVGYYYENKPVGNWKTYYENGKIESNYNYGMLLHPSGSVFTAYSGQYEEYFKNGKLKLSGMYGIGIDTNHVDTTEVYNPATNTTILTTEKVKGYAAVKMGTWRYYSMEGILIREENGW